MAYDSSPAISLYIHLPFCEALCTYCGCNKRITKNHKVESPYVDALLKEWSIYRSQFDRDPIIKEVHLGGGTPTFMSPASLSRLITGILGNVTLSADCEMSFEAHPNSTTYAHLTTLADLGFNRLSIGVQDVSSDILRAINRYQSVKEVVQVTQWAREIGYRSINYDIIYGLPFQQECHMRDTMGLIQEHRPDRIAFYSYAHVPWKSKGQRAFTLSDVPDGIEKSNLYRLGRQLLEDVGYLSIGMDHFCLPNEDLVRAYDRGDMHRNFMGYTPHYTRCAIALGASSIGDSWTMYVQNEKDVETYQSKVNQGQLPLAKGHILSRSEMIIRQHILNLMCCDYTSWDPGSTDDITITPYLSELSGLATDRLVKYTDYDILVTEDGKFFIRNICAAIDPMYQHQDTKIAMYSKAI